MQKSVVQAPISISLGGIQQHLWHKGGVRMDFNIYSILFFFFFFASLCLSLSIFCHPLICDYSSGWGSPFFPQLLCVCPVHPHRDTLFSASPLATHFTREDAHNRDDPLCQKTSSTLGQLESIDRSFQNFSPTGNNNPCGWRKFFSFLFRFQSMVFFLCLSCCRLSGTHFYFTFT